MPMLCLGNIDLFHVFIIGVIVLMSLTLSSLQLFQDTAVMTQIDRNFLFINLNSIAWLFCVVINLGQRAPSTSTTRRDGPIATNAGAIASVADLDGLGLVAHGLISLLQVSI